MPGAAKVFNAKLLVVVEVAVVVVGLAVVALVVVVVAHLVDLLAKKDVLTDGLTDRLTDRRTFAFLELLSQLKIEFYI